MGYFAGEVSCCGDKIFTVCFDQFLVDPRINAVKTLGEANGTQPGEVVVTVLVLGQQYLRMPLVGVVFGKLQFQPFICHEKFTSHNGFDFLVSSFTHKFECAVHVTNIGECHGGHVQRFCLRHHCFDVGCSLEYGILRVRVEVTKGLVRNLNGGSCERVARKLCLFLFGKICFLEVGSFIFDVGNQCIVCRLYYILPDQAKEASRGSSDVVSRVVCVFETLTEKLLVQFDQPWHLESSADTS